ncbi:hypothetical protein JYT81_00670 [Gammaproteobacteria bacterium AH-315-K14]|nr:hypothetical protein [Gammaproteobacteria bacterium AH-315-K14]
MRASLVYEKDGQFDLKQGRGGIADIEFMVQFGVLNWAHKSAGLMAYTDNIRLLDGFTEPQSNDGFLSRKDTVFLAETYRQYRAEVHRLALQDQPAVVSSDAFDDERCRVVKLWQQVLEPVTG